MSYESNLEDTRPQPPVVDGRPMQPGEVYDGDAPSGGMGCGVMALIGTLLALVAVLIVGLATYAGWTSGQREAFILATATQVNRISEQLAFIPQDVASGNTVLLNVRLQFLATLTPGVPEVEAYSATATALYLSQLPTAAPTATATPPPQIETPTPPEEPLPTATSGGFDLAALLQRAQTAVDSGQWSEAIDLLEAINGIDPTYEAATVRRLLSQALNRYAAELYNTYRPGEAGRLAEAIVLTDRAEQIGPLEGGLAYERNAAQLYLDARRLIGFDAFQAIRALERLSSLGPGRYYDEARQELFNQWVALGDAQTQINEHCPAAQYYQSALNILSSGSVAAKRNNANTLCSQATPVPLPGTIFPTTEGGEIAPIGVVPPPGG
jgi:tetratricopeptide (TPR) repeat protein